jgi:hypothetical protein
MITCVVSIVVRCSGWARVVVGLGLKMLGFFWGGWDGGY